ncbi:tetratricopeptide repeat protein [Clostridium sp. AL.422]|uniref:tetratricopeptide repeat protein n=1 Tax=Clostridium TaxID=1485 RepID=UPI00293DBE33|nr:MULTISPECIES: tetratricopeptide repeat protein [unclassified Clostridium]MDV4150018.1 tetratricopeptide repeat protein [Clostridium sp. AL.422]
MKKGLIRNLLLIFIFSTSLFLISCGNASKKITVSENTEDTISLEESETIKAISAGEKLLDEGKFDAAKENFNKAISLDKENKDIYIRIKDKYVSINKLDEAYNIIKIAISNNVDIENMKLILKEISSKFEVFKLSNSVYQNTNYSLPKEMKTNISDAELTIPITWNNENVNTNNIGTFTYEGYNDEYGRKIIVELTVIENVYDKQAGSIKNVYSTNGKNYIDVDLVELYIGFEKVLPEAIKDNRAAINEKGEYFFPNSYYIRDNYTELTTYEVSNNCLIQLLAMDFSTLGYDSESMGSSQELNPVSFDEFKKYITESNKMFLESNSNSENKTLTDRSTLCWIEIKNGVVNSIYRQFTP